MNHPGLFLALEGSDGAGKSTQLKLLEKRLKSEGYDVVVLAFPRYSRRSSYFVKRYLGGQYGPAAEISPYSAAIFYAVDRYDAADEIRRALAAGKIVIADRYTASNMAHQGSKFDDHAQRRGFFIWVETLEYEILGIPRPDKNIYLQLPAKFASHRLKKRSRQTKVAPDEHERDDAHLNSTVLTYELICKLFPKDLIKIDCVQGTKPLTAALISQRLWIKIKSLLPPKPPKK